MKVSPRASIVDPKVLLPVLTDVGRQLKHELRRVVIDWRRCEPPSGTLVWVAATVVHPVLLFLLANVITQLNPALGSCLAMAAIAIFLKARVQKAIVVESVYDLFDARIEQEFTRALAEPVRLDAVDRAGFAVPGIARLVAHGHPAVMVEPKPGLPANLAKLVTTDTAPLPAM